MSFLGREAAFLYLMVETSESELIKNMETITTAQYLVLKKVSGYILDDTIPMNPREFTILDMFYKFICRLATGSKISSKILIKNLEPIVTMCQMALKHYEGCAESRACAEGRLGQNQNEGKSATYQRNRGKIGTDSNPSTTDGGESSSDSSNFFSSQSTESDSQSS